MSNFKDFDLDLKKNNEKTDVKSVSIIIPLTIKECLTMKNCTRSVINPTTGMTIGCCYGRATKDNDVRLMCI